MIRSLWLNRDVLAILTDSLPFPVLIFLLVDPSNQLIREGTRRSRTRTLLEDGSWGARLGS